MQVQKKQRRYLIKWKGFSNAENTWEPEKNLNHCRAKIQQFHRQNPTIGKETNHPQERHHRATRQAAKKTEDQEPVQRILSMRWRAPSPYPDQAQLALTRLELSRSHPGHQSQANQPHDQDDRDGQCSPARAQTFAFHARGVIPPLSEDEDDDIALAAASIQAEELQLASSSSRLQAQATHLQPPPIWLRDPPSAGRISALARELVKEFRELAEDASEGDIELDENNKILIDHLTALKEQFYKEHYDEYPAELEYDNPLRNLALEEYYAAEIEWIRLETDRHPDKHTIRVIAYQTITKEWKEEHHSQSDFVVTRSQEMCDRTQEEHLPDDDKSTMQDLPRSAHLEQGIGMTTRDGEDSILRAEELASSDDRDGGIAPDDSDSGSGIGPYDDWDSEPDEFEESYEEPTFRSSARQLIIHPDGTEELRPLGW
jgi:hypothetical protein